MTTEEKDIIIQSVLDGFDFDEVHSIMEHINWGQIFQNGKPNVPSVEHLKKTARKILELVVKHDEEDFWWAGTGGLYATIDKKRGITMFFVPTKFTSKPQHGKSPINVA